MVDVIKLILSQTAEKSVENATNSTKSPTTPEGMAVAYGSMLVMAMLPIFLGSFRSVHYHKSNKPEKMTSRDAAVFPIMASGALLGLYIVFKIFSVEYINLLLTGYFFFLGVLALTHLLSPVMNKLVPATIPNIPYHIMFKKGEGESAAFLVDYKFSSYDVISLIGCLFVGIWYLMKKHWIANNLFGLAFAVNAIELLHLNNLATGCILLVGLFFYDIFWVFGTDVMVTVAKGFEAPIKLLFPRDLLQSGLASKNFMMLGLGDIVIPGIFIAFLLRYDVSTKRKNYTYFSLTFLGYFVGLISTFLVMHIFKHAQPALLYLVPACILTPLFWALLQGDIKALFSYEDASEETETTKKTEKTNKTDSKKSK